MWCEDDKMLVILNRFEKKDSFPCECPICGKKAVHSYLHRFDDDEKGAAWVWCGECGAFSHVTYLIPEWWENYPQIDEEELVSDPDYLNKFSDEIDNHISGLIS